MVDELYYGAFKSQRVERNVALVDALQFEVLKFDQEDAREAGAIRALLATRGTPIGPYDVLIAGQAKARGLTLVTRNTGEFQRVTGLRVQNWERGRAEQRAKRHRQMIKGSVRTWMRLANDERRESPQIRQG